METYIISNFKFQSLDSYPSTLANSDTNYIIFKNVEIFKNYFFEIKKYFEG
jgi:hypothetical protein